MPVQDRRSRSTTAASQRPPSRASTTSIHTAPLLPVEQQLAQYAQTGYAHQHVNNQQQMIEHYTGPSDAEIMALQGHSFDSQVQGLPIEADPHMQMQSHPQNGYYPPQQAHYGGQPQGMDYSQMQAPPLRPMSASGTSNGKGKKKGGSATIAANEKHEQELKDLVEKNRGRTLGDVGAEVLRNERTSKCEKSKQLFAMLWFVFPNILSLVSLSCCTGLKMHASLPKHRSLAVVFMLHMQNVVGMSEYSH
jgi:regulatory factor X